MLLEQTAAEEDLSAPGLSMTVGSKSVFISVNQCHRWFYNSYKGLQFSGLLTEARGHGGVEFLGKIKGVKFEWRSGLGSIR